MIYLILLVITAFVSTEKPYFYNPINLFVGDNNSSTIFREESRKGNAIGILFTNKYCKECQFYDQELQETIEQIYQKFKIKIYRSQLGSNNNLQQQFNIKRFPMIHFVLPLTNSYRIFISNQILTKTTTLKLTKKLKYYLNQSSDIQQKEYILVNQQNMIYTDQENIIQMFGLNSLFYQLPYLKITTTSSFKHQLESNKDNFFEANTCLVYTSRSHQCHQPKNVEQLEYLLSFINFQRVNQFTQAIFKHYQNLQMNRYIFVTVLDSIFLRQKSNQYLDMLNQIMQKRQFKHRIVIFWMETQINKQKLQLLGFQKNDHPPLFAQFGLVNKNKKILQNKDVDGFNKKNIEKFIKNIIKFDQVEDTKKWNWQLLQLSVKRLGFDRKLSLIKNKQEFKLTQSVNIILSLPFAQYQALENNELFYEPLLSFNYFFRRIQRFSSLKSIGKFATFLEIKCQGKQSSGLFIVSGTQCKKIYEKQVIKPEEILSSNMKYLQQKFNLPEYFYINQNIYSEFISNIESKTLQPNYSYVYIDI